jgi:hypothetical protein
MEIIKIVRAGVEGILTVRALVDGPKADWSADDAEVFMDFASDVGVNSWAAVLDLRFYESGGYRGQPGLVALGLLLHPLDAA